MEVDTKETVIQPEGANNVKKRSHPNVEKDEFSEPEDGGAEVKMEVDDNKTSVTPATKAKRSSSRSTTPKKKMKLEDDEEPVKRASHLQGMHSMSESVLLETHTDLLAWYDENQRQMPWRVPSESYKAKHAAKLQVGEYYDPETSKFDQAYGALVSELMLQQTQVVTVRAYFEKWMQKFPTVQSLASASLDEVNAVWAGLGYYRRAKLIHECAKAIVADHAGKIPQTAAELEKLPGLGRYTAGAIASVVFGEQAPIVDGNVVRVLTRFRAIDADAKNLKVVKRLWFLSSQLVPSSRPGDFNQALMELGALVCTKSNPNCTECPLAKNCLALKESKAQDWKAQVQAPADTEIEDLCDICTPDPVNATSVTKYPVKGAKKEKKKLATHVCVLRCNLAGNQKEESSGKEAEAEWMYLMKKRPEGGLLAGFWEFPAIDMPAAQGNDVSDAQEGDEDNDAELDADQKPKIKKESVAFPPSPLTEWAFWKHEFGIQIDDSMVLDRQSLGNYEHKFTHIDQSVCIEKLDLQSHELPSIAFEASKTPEIRASSDSEGTLRWVSQEQLNKSEFALSKVSTVCLDRIRHPPTPKKEKAKSTSAKKKTAAVTPDKKQRSILSMFGAKK
jgi:A/G-specific adenine glycosylase